MIDLIKSRRSIRKYKSIPVPEETIDEVLDCARLAPTARNIQPWLIGAITDKEVLKKLGGIVKNGRFIAHAPLCFAVFSLKDEKYFIEDGCAATMNIIYACEAHGLGSCWIAGHKKEYAEEVRKLLRVSEDYTLISLIAAGYPDEKPEVKNKKAKEEVTFKL